MEKHNRVRIHILQTEVIRAKVDDVGENGLHVIAILGREFFDANDRVDYHQKGGQY